MNGIGKALVGMIHVSMDRLMARKISSGVTMLALAVIVLLVAAGGERGDANNNLRGIAEYQQ